MPDRTFNCISVDVEGFVESNLQSFHIANRYINQKKENNEIEKNINTLLLLLENTDKKATFFFLGRIARDMPFIVRRVAQYGHEIGCHGFNHERIFEMTREEFKNKVSSAKKILEDVSGKKVLGFRAPDFSITKSSKWALDILLEIGFQYDSSIYPIGIHDVYGIVEENPILHELPNGLIEFPLSSASFMGIRFPFGGGGYFRLYPIILTKYCILKKNLLGHPSMFYIHPYEVGPVMPKISELSFYRKFRHYYHCKNGYERLKEILSTFEFCPAFEILEKRKLTRGISL